MYIQCRLLKQPHNNVRHKQCAVKGNAKMPSVFRYVCGSLEYYEKSYDRVTTKNEVPLAGVNRIFHKVTTTDDPIIRKVCAVEASQFSDHQMKIMMMVMLMVIRW